jgi:hypothetical protein
MLNQKNINITYIYQLHSPNCILVYIYMIICVYIYVMFRLSRVTSVRDKPAKLRPARQIQ